MLPELNENISFKAACQKIFVLALPMTLSQLVSVASGFLCMAMLAKLGHEVLAASALIFSTQMSIMVIGMSVLFSLSILVGHAYGAKNYSDIGNYIQQGWTLSIIIGLPIIIFFWHIDVVLIHFGQLPAIASIVKTFFHAYVWGVIPMLLLVCNQQLGFGIHKQKLIILSNFLGVIVLLTTAYALIFGKLGMPTLGVAGLGYAMVAQYCFVFIFTILFFYYDKAFKHFDLFNYRVHQNWGHFIQMFKIGWPISVQMGGEMLSFFVCAAMIGWLGTSALAAYQVVNQYLFLIVIPIFSLSQASGILIGQACGGKRFNEIKQLGYSSIGVALIMTLIVAFIFIFIPKNLASFYLDVNNAENAKTVELIILLFSVIAISQIFDGIRNILTGMLRGLFDTKFPMVVGLLIIWLFIIPLNYFLAFNLHWGVVGFAIGSACGMLVGAVIMACRWHKMSKKYSGINNGMQHLIRNHKTC